MNIPKTVVVTYKGEQYTLPTRDSMRKKAYRAERSVGIWSRQHDLPGVAPGKAPTVQGRCLADSPGSDGMSGATSALGHGSPRRLLAPV